MRRNAIRPALAGVIALVVAAPAHAHLATTGLGPVYDGISHLLMSPGDLIPVIALALFAGLRGAAYGRAVLFVLPVAWLAGGGIGFLFPSTIAPAWSALLLLVLGGLVAADARISRSATASIAALVGAGLGYLSGADVAKAPGAMLALVGGAAVIGPLTALVAAWVVTLRRSWSRIAVRVAGSWVAATGLLLVGWSLRSAN